MVGQSLFTMDLFWPKLAGQFAGEGAIGALTGARNLVALAAGVLAFSTGVTTVLTLRSNDSTRQRLEQAHITFRLWLTVAGTGAATTMALAFPLVRLLFHHGAFDRPAVEAVSTLVLFYALGIPSTIALTTYTQALMTLEDRWRPVRLAAATTAGSAVVIVVLVRLMGSSGVAFGSVIATTAGAVVLGRAWHSGDRRLVVEGLGGDVARIAFSTAAAGISGVLLVGLATRLNVPDVIATLLGAAMVTIAFLIVARTTGSPEAEAVWQMLSGSREARHGRRSRRTSRRTRQPL
jgi:putative peptidoglycan lipid II flippase